MARALGGELIGEDMDVASFSSDTREIRSGDCFIALKGERFDANAMLGKAAEAGAAAAIVSSADRGVSLSQVVVADAAKALGELGALWRSQFDQVRVAITGSSGKTTVKEMLASIFSQGAETLATLGNKNNELGVPLTLLRLRPEHRFGVFELGANHKGEIAYTSNLVRPHAAGINNIGVAHLEGFGSRQGIADAKSEIFEGLVEGGIAVINLDDEFADYCRQKVTGHGCITVSATGRPADVMALNVRPYLGALYEFDLACGQKTVPVRLPLLGAHNVSNAVMAAGLATAVGVSPEQIRTGLELAQPAKGRLNVHQCSDRLIVIDDTYNANPASMKAAIDVLVQMPGRHVLVCGDMGELGAKTEEGHREVGEWAKMKKVDALYAVGQYASFTLDGFGSSQHRHSDQQQLLQDLERELEGVVSILVKGSRSARMENVVEAILQKQEQN